MPVIITEVPGAPEAGDRFDTLLIGAPFTNTFTLLIVAFVPQFPGSVLSPMVGNLKELP